MEKPDWSKKEQGPKTQEQIVEECRQVLYDYLEDDPLMRHEELMKFVDELRAEFPEEELRKYKLYNLLIGNSMESLEKELDFEDHRVEKFFESLKNTKK